MRDLAIPRGKLFFEPGQAPLSGGGRNEVC
jgi:hypothetical protein